MTSQPTVSKAVAERTKTVRTLIEEMKPQIARALPKHMDADRLARIALTVVRQTPKLAQATPESLLGALMTCAQLGLEPGPLGHAYLVPYGKEVQFIPGYRGLVDLARRSGQVQSVQARVVHEGDVFDYAFGLNPKLDHKPAATKGELTHAYAVIRLKDGGVDFDVMDRAAIERIRTRSKAATNGPWVTDYDEMAKKTVLRRLLKTAPMSIEYQQAVAQDEQVRTTFDGADLDFVPEGVDEDGVIDAEVVDDAPANTADPELPDPSDGDDPWTKGGAS